MFRESFEGLSRLFRACLEQIDALLAKGYGIFG